jgi:proteasome lid subunit RPN8/RPN11
VTTLVAEELAAIQRQAVGEYPYESCGVILARGEERRLVPCRNIQNELHAKDPARHPRDARTAYYIDPKELLMIGRLEGEGFRVRVIYHSHVDAGAYFSETDRRQALVGGEPAYPDATYIVTAVVGAGGPGAAGVAPPRVEAVAAFRWNEKRRDFVPVELDVPALSPDGVR